jgi:hypothetical protein
METAWRIVGALCASAAVFGGVMAFALWITKGSAWMIAFLPLVMGGIASVDVIVLAPMFRDEELCLR